MKKWRRNGAIILLILALVVGFMLPTVVSRFQDSQTDQTEEVVSANSVQLNMGSALTLLQRLRIVAERTSSVELESAQTMDDEQALNELFDGLETLFSADLEGFPFKVGDFSEVNHQILLKMSGEDSLIYWEYWLADNDGNQISAAVDDDTGVILSLRYTLSLTSEEEEPEQQLELPDLPLFLIPEITEDTASIFATNGIFVGLEETGSSAETFAEVLQEQYCGAYLREKGYYLSWEPDTSEPVDNSYLYSVMVVDNDGGYYVLPVTVSNNEIAIN